MRVERATSHSKDRGMKRVNGCRDVVFEMVFCISLPEFKVLELCEMIVPGA